MFHRRGDYFFWGAHISKENRCEGKQIGWESGCVGSGGMGWGWGGVGVSTSRIGWGGSISQQVGGDIGNRTVKNPGMLSSQKSNMHGFQKRGHQQSRASTKRRKSIVLMISFKAMPIMKSSEHARPKNTLACLPPFCCWSNQHKKS